MALGDRVPEDRKRRGCGLQSNFSGWAENGKRFLYVRVSATSKWSNGHERQWNRGDVLKGLVAPSTALVIPPAGSILPSILGALAFAVIKAQMAEATRNIALDASPVKISF
jgi:hypothetical protein